MNSRLPRSPEPPRAAPTVGQRAAVSTSPCNLYSLANYDEPRRCDSPMRCPRVRGLPRYLDRPRSLPAPISGGLKLSALLGAGEDLGDFVDLGEQRVGGGWVGAALRAAG